MFFWQANLLWGGYTKAGTTGGLRPQLRRDAKTEGENELSHADRSADLRCYTLTGRAVALSFCFA